MTSPATIPLTKAADAAGDDLDADFDADARSGDRRGSPSLRERLHTLLTSLIPQPRDDIPVFWSRLSLTLVVIEALVLFVLEGVVLGYDTAIYFDNKNVKEKIDSLQDNLKAGRTHQNFVQVIAVLGYSIGCFVFSFVQIKQTTTTDGYFYSQWPSDLEGDNVAQILISVVTGVWMVAFAYLVFKMFGEFGWTIYRVTGGDKKMERAFTNYHIMQISVKFSIFFVFLFAIIILVSILR
ncbi:hypothetical protein HK405_012713, partial [Cladochytrium tenue]